MSEFFEKQTDESRVKTQIVVKYFATWARVMLPSVKRRGNRMAYIDLYAGPGRYNDGATSTPLRVLGWAANDPAVSKVLVSYLNDANKESVVKLQKEISELAGIEKLKYEPSVNSGLVDKDLEDYFNATHMIPSFTFFDPWGYKGLTRNIIAGVIKDWGCECVLFFNYRRIRISISNKKVEKHMVALFGEKHLHRLKERLAGPSHFRRKEAIVLDEIKQAIGEIGGKYVLPFAFLNHKGRATHHIIFVSKNFLGYDIMKNIMAVESTEEVPGVPSFTYSPNGSGLVPLMFEPDEWMDWLQKSLTKTLPKILGDRELSAWEIYEQHSVGTPYIFRNYQKVFLRMENQGLIEARTLKSRRQKNKFARELLVRLSTGGNNG